MTKQGNFTQRTPQAKKQSDQASRQISKQASGSANTPYDLVFTAMGPPLGTTQTTATITSTEGLELGADNLTLEGVATELAPSDFVSQNYETLVALMQEETKKRSSQSLRDSDTHEHNDWRISVHDRLGSRDVHSRLGQRRSSSESPPNNSSEIKLRGRLLASFQDDAKYEHVGQDTRSQGGKDDHNKNSKEGMKKSENVVAQNKVLVKIILQQGVSFDPQPLPQSYTHTTSPSLNIWELEQRRIKPSTKKDPTFSQESQSITDVVASTKTLDVLSIQKNQQSSLMQKNMKNTKKTQTKRLLQSSQKLQYYTIDVVIKRFLTRLQGRLRDWYHSLGEYRQLQIQQSISPKAFMSIIYSEFIGSPWEHTTHAREEFLKMKCCSF
ncbi:hypothetical protein Tco_0525299 [Tanacetum coccineum]